MPRKIDTNCHTKHKLKSMIEYMLISSTLYRICEMIKKPLEYRRYDSWLIPPERGEHNGKGQLTKQINGRHGDGWMQR
jgi:hypothetical protein